MNKMKQVTDYFPFDLPLSAKARKRLELEGGVDGGKLPRIVFARQVANRMNSLPEMHGRPVQPSLLNLWGIMGKIYRYLALEYTEDRHPAAIEDAIKGAGYEGSSADMTLFLKSFARLFPPAPVVEKKESPESFVAKDGPDKVRRSGILRESLLLMLATENPALDSFRELFDDTELAALSPYRRITEGMENGLRSAPPFDPFDLPLVELLRAPMKASPNSLPGQMEYIRENWGRILPAELMEEMLTAFDIIREDERHWWEGPGRPQVLEFLKGGRLGKGGYEYPEYERFSRDADWMANVVMIAKMTYVWLDQLSKKYGRPIHRLDQVPDEELDRLAGWGVTALWLIGLWERSAASQKIKQIGGNQEAAASAYSLYDYVIAHDLGGEAALANLKERCQQRGIRLASDMVPNHTGIYSKWTVEHPDWFVQLDYPPYPDYSFNGPDLSFASDVSLHIEDGYWDRRNAAVVFKHYDHRDGRTRYIYHGNDGTSTPWNDTAQLNYLIPQVREAVIQTILHVARQFPIIRFDAAMTLAKKHYQRLWYPQPGHGSGVPSRAEHGMSREEFDAAFPEEFWREVVDRVAAEAPDTLLLAEAFWLMEGYFVRTLGMHRVYNSAFMNMLKMEENAKYRQTVKNVLEFNPEILKRFVNFMNNPDERTAIEQFGREGKYIGACVLLVTMPGLPMLGHGQVEGFHEKYGMEYRKACWDEPVDEHLVWAHEERIFPLMRRRWLFSGSDNFVFYDLFAGGGVDENVFAYSNRSGGERGVVLFNNRYGDTAGWIRTSTAMARKNGKGDSAIVQTTLGEALGFNPDSRVYYAFRDYADGLEYIRSGKELCEKGLFAEFSGYAYHAFLDFREIWDDEFGNWGKLCHGLSSRGVGSLDAEFRQVRHAVPISLFRELAAEVAETLQSADTVAKTALKSKLEQFYSAMNEHAGCSGDAKAVAEEAFALLADVALLVWKDMAESLQTDAEATTVRRPEETERLLLAAWIILYPSGKLAAAEDYPRVAACWLDELGLSSCFSSLLRPGEPSTLDAEGCALLLKLLLSCRRFFARWERAEAHARFVLLFADAVARRFLERHESGGAEWFNRERFHMFLERLPLLGALSCEGDERLQAFSTLGKELHYLKALAAESGYRVDAFLRLLEVKRKDK